MRSITDSHARDQQLADTTHTSCDVNNNESSVPTAAESEPTGSADDLSYFLNFVTKTHDDVDAPLFVAYEHSSSPQTGDGVVVSSNAAANLHNSPRTNLPLFKAAATNLDVDPAIRERVLGNVVRTSLRFGDGTVVASSSENTNNSNNDHSSSSNTGGSATSDGSALDLLGVSTQTVTVKSVGRLAYFVNQQKRVIKIEARYKYRK